MYLLKATNVITCAVLLVAVSLVSCGGDDNDNDLSSSFDDNADNALEMEGITMLGSINRGQMVYSLENDGFATDIESLGLGLPSETDRYVFAIESADATQAIATATAKDESLPSAIAAIFMTEEGASQDIICATPGTATPPAAPTLVGGEPECAADSVQFE